MCYVVNIPIKKTFVLYSLMLDVSIAPLTIVYVYIYIAINLFLLVNFYMVTYILTSTIACISDDQTQR